MSSKLWKLEQFVLAFISVIVTAVKLDLAELVGGLWFSVKTG